MGCWDIPQSTPKTEDEIREIAEALSKHPVYVKFFEIPNRNSNNFLDELAAPVDYLSLME